MNTAIEPHPTTHDLAEDNVISFYSEINVCWLAHKEGMNEGDPIGRGDTEQAAIDDLELKLGDSE